MSTLTKGSLTPAKITNLSDNTVVNFMFNPFEYTISKSNSWKKKEVTGKNMPEMTFQSGGAMTLKLTLHFDTYAELKDVRQYTDPLWKMMMLDASNKNSQSNKSTPPPVAFEWGRLYFKAIITSMSQKFTLFGADGVPLRCQVDISLEQYMDESQVEPQITLSSYGTTAPYTITVDSSNANRPDLVAHAATGNVNDQRAVANANGSNNMSYSNGQSISTP